MDYAYRYGPYSIEKCIRNHISSFLSNNIVSFKRVTAEIRIVEDTSFVKSKDAGNYYFDPYCDAIQIRVRRKDRK